MDEQPDIAILASLIGDPARSRILLALMGGRALTATELSLEAEVSPSTASAHLAKLSAAHLIVRQKQGRHRYFQIADEQVARLIEELCGLAARDRVPGVATGPKDPALRRARVCYDHLAGELAVRLFESLLGRGWLDRHGEGIELTEVGERGLARLGFEIDSLKAQRRVTCRQCLDWSERRHHLAGALGAAILAQIYERKWARRDLNTRAVLFSDWGEAQLSREFELGKI